MSDYTITHSAPTLGAEEREAAARVLESGKIAQGAEVEAFEKECAEFAGRRHGVAVSSGTAALHLALGALGVDAGSRVVLPSYACAALTTAVALQGAKSYLCDVGSDYGLALGTLPEHYDVCIAVHMFGATAQLPEDVRVIEDIAQSFGGATGCASEVSITSFYATKLMTTGEGGMLLTDEEGIAEYARDHRDYDNRNDFVSRNNYKMTDIQGAIGRAQLKNLPGFIKKRLEIAEKYDEGLEELPLEVMARTGHVYFRYVVAGDDRDALQTHLAGHGIEAKRPVHMPAHLLANANEPFEGCGNYFGSQQAHERVLSLPIYPNLDDEAISSVLRSTQQFFALG